MNFARRSGLLVSALVLVSMAAMPGRLNAEDQKADSEYSDREFAKDLLAFQQASWVQTYRMIGRRDGAWDKPAVNFLEKFCQNAAYAMVWRGIVPDDIPHDDEVRRLGDEIISRHCDDAQVRAAYGSTLLMNGCTLLGERELRAAVRGMNDGKHQAYNILYVCNLLLQSETQRSWEPGEADAISKMAIDAAVRCMCDVPPTRAERYIRFRMLHLVIQHAPKIEEKIAKQLETAKNVDPWLLAVFTGERETHLAWAARGNGLANAVTEKGWRGFESHLQSSRKQLDEAIKIDPAVPGPAALMITVAMGLSTEGDDSPRAWFNRARNAKMDDQWALESLLWSMRPRWGGSYDQIFSLGKELVASNRFDTKVPIWLMDAILTISNDRGETDAASFGEPEVYDALKSMFAGYARSLPHGAGRDFVLSEQAAVAFIAGRYIDSRTILEQLGPRLQRRAFSLFTKDPDLAVSQVYAMTGGQGDSVRVATTEAKTHDPNALKHFTDLAATCKPRDPEAYYYNSFVANLRFEADLTTGNWVDLQPHDGLFLWQPIHGKWEINGDKLIGTCDGSGLMLRLRPKAGEAFEIEARLEYEPTAQGANACGIFCDHNGQTWANGVFYSVGYHDVSWYVNMKTGVVSHPLENANLLHLRMSYGKLTATFNGQPVPIPGMAPPAADLGDSARVCIAGLYPDAQLSLVVTDLKIRKLVAGKN